MDRDSMREELRKILTEYIENQGLVLVDVIFRYEGRDLFLRLLVDRPEGGISIDECSRLNSRIGAILEEKSVIPGGYILEISSPGLDRPLIVREDFLRCINKEVVFFLREPLGGRFELTGKITQVTEDTVKIDVGGNLMEIPLASITKAKQKF